jgi:hypothetical protein
VTGNYAARKINLHEFLIHFASTKYHLHERYVFSVPIYLTVNVNFKRQTSEMVVSLSWPVLT